MPGVLVSSPVTNSEVFRGPFNPPDTSTDPFFNKTADDLDLAVINGALLDQAAFFSV